MAKSPKPDFIDNLNGNTMASALKDVLGVDAKCVDGSPGAPPDEVRIATAYFSLSGFGRIADHLESIPTVRLLLGTDMNMGAYGARLRLGESQDEFEKRRLQNGMRRMDRALRNDRDGLKFGRSNAQVVRKLIEVLRRGNMEVRQYRTDFLHAKAYIFTGDDSAKGDVANKSDGIIAGSSNLTGAGLSGNRELNLGRYDQAVVKRGTEWFDGLWEDAEPYDLADLFDDTFQLRTPWQVFIRVLWNLYGDEVQSDTENDKNLPLTAFQKHGVARALRLIQETGGAIFADEVGLGKTFVAGEVLKIYQAKRQRALVVCPASLRDSTWKKFSNRFDMRIECVSFEQLANDEQIHDDDSETRSGKEHLLNRLNEYQLIIVDEAHNYRNPNTPMRSDALLRLLESQPDVLLLTATPVNNSLWDLFYLIRFFVRQDAQFADRGILSIKGLFKRAMCEDPASLSPDILYPVIDATTVKRTRQFVNKYYMNETIIGPEGNPVPIVFPKPEAIRVDYNLDDIMPGLFDKLEAALDPDGDDAIRFARYMPDDYLLGDDVPAGGAQGKDGQVDTSDLSTDIQADKREENARARAMVGLLRTGILKRFESSACAFRRTVEKMSNEHGVFLDALDAGQVVNTKFMKELSGDDDFDINDALAVSSHPVDAKLYDVPRLRDAVHRDRDLLRELAEEAKKITPDRDPKLKELVKELAEIAKQAKNQATDQADEKQKRKVLVFSYFEDTVEWICEHLEAQFDLRVGITCYKGCMQPVSGSDKLSKVSRKQAVEGFAPVSMESPKGEDKYDLLVTTDVLAEGVNLQQCRHIINYDMPWNPMRLVQRHGRIDRIGSPHKYVELRTIFPVDRLDAMLDLVQRIYDKLAMAAASIGVEGPIEGSAHSSRNFTEKRDEIDKLLNNNPSLYERGRATGAALTGEEYRQSLRSALHHDKTSIVDMPWKVGSGMVKGSRRGMFFCAVIGRHEGKGEAKRKEADNGETLIRQRTYLRFVPADNSWGVAVPESAVGVWGEEESSGVTARNSIVRELGACLRLIECEPDTDKECSDEMLDRVYDFWEVAQRDILADWTRQTDPKNIQPRVRRINHLVADFIRNNTPVGMDDDAVTRALNIVEQPWLYRDEMMLRKWFNSNERKGSAHAKFLVGEILKTGIWPAVLAPLLPHISIDDIELLCWMGIERYDEQPAGKKK